MGTRFVATREATVHPALKQALVDHRETDTRLIMRTLRNTERVLATETVETILLIEARGGATIADLAPYVSGLRGKSEVLEKGNVSAGAIAAGQSMGLIHDIPSVRELIERTVQEAEERLDKRRWIRPA